MGICLAISPQQRTIRNQNSALQTLLVQKLQDLSMYGFAARLRQTIPSMPKRYMFTQAIMEDITGLLEIVEQNRSIKIESVGPSIEEEYRNSCLIMEDQLYQDKNPVTGSFVGQENSEYQRNLTENESLVCQINIIYQRDFDLATYTNALKLFLKWSTMFHEHFSATFLKPLFRQFCINLYKIDQDDLESIVDETSVFVQYMVAVYTEVYSLRKMSESANGCLFKNENVFNLIMASIFKRTKLKQFVRGVIRNRDQKKIDKFKSKLAELQGRDLDYFGVERKFQLSHPSTSSNKLDNSINLSTHTNSEEQKLLFLHPPQPYLSCLPALQNLCLNSQTPITKLKLIVQLSKKITSEIYTYYDQKQKSVPDLDPDNLTGIIMYIIVRANRPQLYEELKIAELFTTTNCLTCISGYYLNTFNAAIETLLTL